MWFDKLTTNGQEPFFLSLSKDRECAPLMFLNILKTLVGVTVQKKVCIPEFRPALYWSIVAVISATVPSVGVKDRQVPVIVLELS